MNSKDLRELAPLFSHFDAYRQVLSAAENRSDSCDCIEQIAVTGGGVPRSGGAGPLVRRYQPSGRCAEALASGGKPVNSCQTVVHLGIRAHLATISMPVDHMGDDELDHAVIDVLHGLVLRAPQITQQQFVDQLRAALHADRVVAATDTESGDRTDG